jgi:hypothetical protein
MFFQPIFQRASGPDIRGHIMRCHDMEHARAMAPEAIRIDEVPAAGVRGYYDHIDGPGTYWTSDAARLANSLPMTDQQSAAIAELTAKLGAEPELSPFIGGAVTAFYSGRISGIPWCREIHVQPDGEPIVAVSRP